LKEDNYTKGVKEADVPKTKEDTLSLGPNERYREAIELAAERTGLPPATIAAVIDAEAAKASGATLNAMTDEEFYGRHPELDGRPLTRDDTQLIKEWKGINRELNGVWDPNSANSETSARGLTQFLSGTWKQEARQEGTYLNEVARQLGYVDSNNKIRDEAGLLKLRFDPTVSIVAAAEYDKSTFDTLSKESFGGKPLIPENLGDDEKAKYLYLGHHEGEEGARQVLTGTLTNERAADLLESNVPNEATRNRLIQSAGSESAAYRAWLWKYIDNRVKPSRFR